LRNRVVAHIFAIIWLQIPDATPNAIAEHFDSHQRAT